MNKATEVSGDKQELKTYSQNFKSEKLTLANITKLP